MKPSIRRAGLEDLPALLALEERAFSTDRFNGRQFRHLLTRARARFLVATQADQLLGYGVNLYRAGATRARLYGIAVAECARGQGVASALIAALAADARSQGCRSLGLEVRTDNTAAQRLYQRLGFQGEGTLSDYYEDGTAAVRMALALTD